jgi:hypothetical protein
MAEATITGSIVQSGSLVSFTAASGVKRFFTVLEPWRLPRGRGYHGLGLGWCHKRNVQAMLRLYRAKWWWTPPTVSDPSPLTITLSVITNSESECIKLIHDLPEAFQIHISREHLSHGTLDSGDR